jgi:hypothetical protein
MKYEPPTTVSTWLATVRPPFGVRYLPFRSGDKRYFARPLKDEKDPPKDEKDT